MIKGTDIIGWVNTEGGEHCCPDCAMDAYYTGNTDRIQTIMLNISGRLFRDGYLAVFASDEVVGEVILCDACNAVISKSAL